MFVMALLTKIEKKLILIFKWNSNVPPELFIYYAFRIRWFMKKMGKILKTIFKSFQI